MTSLRGSFYYTADNNTFLNKIEALSYGQKTNQKVFFYYYDDVYDKINWNIEPPESLEYYYLEQAIKIRDSYDKIILAYSGGYDSTNILETFHFNGLKFDKIITVGALKQDSYSGVDENHNGELYHNVFPYLKELGLESISEVYDYTTYFNDLKNFSIYQYGENWINNIGSWYSPHNWFWKDIEKYIIPREWQDKKVALIMGRDKPSLFQSPDGKQTMLPNRACKLTGFYFRDSPVYSYGNISGTDNCDRINFYWDPTFPKILLKQLHIIKRAYDIQCEVGYDTNVCTQTLGGKTINGLIYNLKKPLLFKSPKSKDIFLSLRDQYLKDKTNSDVWAFYQKGLAVINEKVGGLTNIVPIQSRFYALP
jgi:hypothetical protein